VTLVALEQSLPLRPWSRRRMSFAIAPLLGFGRPTSCLRLCNLLSRPTRKLNVRRRLFGSIELSSQDLLISDIDQTMIDECPSVACVTEREAPLPVRSQLPTQFTQSAKEWIDEARFASSGTDAAISSVDSACLIRNLWPNRNRRIRDTSR
jgi:hypothetical protein